VMLPRNLTELLIKWHGLLSSLFCHSERREEPLIIDFLHVLRAERGGI